MLAAENKKTEAALIMEGQVELFPSVTEPEVEQALCLLKAYKKVKIRVTDYEQNIDRVHQMIAEVSRGRLSDEDLYTNKTANAVILLEEQKKQYEKGKLFMYYIERAQRIILDDDARKAIHYRYLEGYSHKETLLFFSRGTRDRTIERRLNLGILSMTETLKLDGALHIDWSF